MRQRMREIIVQGKRAANAGYRRGGRGRRGARRTREMWRATDAGDHCTGETCPWESSAAYELDGDCGRELTSSREMFRAEVD